MTASTRRWARALKASSMISYCWSLTPLIFAASSAPVVPRWTPTVFPSSWDSEVTRSPLRTMIDWFALK